MKIIILCKFCVLFGWNLIISLKKLYTLSSLEEDHLD